MLECFIDNFIYCKTGVNAIDDDINTIYTTELFHTAYWLNDTARHFNQSDYEQIDIMPMLAGYPDLPSWMMFYRRSHSPIVYFYGSPPKGEDGDIEIEMILIDRFTFNHTKDRLHYRILSKNETYKYEVQIKLFDIDLEDFIQQNRSKSMMDIFRRRLWRTNATIYLTNLYQPSKIGFSFPLDPTEKEGLVVRIGSVEPYTPELLKLEDETMVIRHRNPCPKRFRLTTAEYIFREHKFRVDWCGFRLHTVENVTKDE